MDANKSGDLSFLGKYNLRDSIKKKGTIVSIGFLLSASLVLYDLGTYLAKVKDVLEDPKIREVYSNDKVSDEKKQERIYRIFEERNYPLKLEEKMEKSENIFKIAKAMAGISVGYFLVSSSVSLANHSQRRKNLERQLTKTSSK